MKSKSAFLRKLILYGYVYDVDYSFLREYNTELGRISSSLNQIAKRINSTSHVYQEHNLSVIIPGGERGKKYNEWQSDKNGAAWKTQIRKDINSAIKAVSTYEEFLFLIRAKGYEIKGENFGEDAPKYISFRPLGKDRFVRGSVKSLGKEYTKERIKERIEMKRERKAVIPKKDYSNRKLVDTSDEKFQNSPGLQRWAAIENLKIAAQAYNIAYKKAKNPDAYFRKHESQIILYGGARRMLEQAGISLKGLNIDKLKAEYQELAAQKNILADYTISMYDNIKICKKIGVPKHPYLLNPLAKSAVLVYNHLRSRRILHVRRLFNRKLIKRKNYGLQGYPLLQ